MNPDIKVQELVCLCIGTNEVIPVEEIYTIERNSPSGGKFRAFMTEAQDAVAIQHKESGDIILINVASTEPAIITDVEHWAETRYSRMH